MPATTYFRYPPISDADRQWEMFVTTAGYDAVPKGSSAYSSIMPLHPPEYRFDWRGGRTLQECQIIYTISGQGMYETRETGRRAIHGGDAFLVLPGQWHRYWPDPETGWTEYWVGLDGPYIKRLCTQGFFQAPDLIFHPGPDPAWGNLFTQLIETLRTDPLGCQQISTGIAFGILARAGVLARLQKEPGPVEETLPLILRAKGLIAARLTQEFDGQALAQELGMGYSRFRQRFAQYTGFSPGQYHQQMRVARAKHLLGDTALAVKEVARDLGMDAYYFSHLFKQKTGLSPENWRAQARPQRRRL